MACLAAGCSSCSLAAVVVRITCAGNRELFNALRLKRYSASLTVAALCQKPPLALCQDVPSRIEDLPIETFHQVTRRISLWHTDLRSEA